MRAASLVVGIFLSLATFVITTTSFSQQPVTSSLWIRVWDVSQESLTVEYGNDVNATYGRDDGKDGTYDLGEFKCPIVAPGPLFVTWESIPGRPFSLMGCHRDYRPVPANPTEKDTFQLFFSKDFAVNTTILFAWPDSSYLGLKCDSMFFVFTDSGNIVRVIDMFAQSSLVIPQASTKGIQTAFIYKYGVKLVDGVEEQGNQKPKGFTLFQSFPNPFNPVTTIRYNLSTEQHITLTVYNTLGEVVAELLDEEQSAGLKSISFDAGRLPSGMYVCRITAGTFTDQKKLLLIK